MTPDDLTRIKFLHDPRISPDGQRVAFVVTTLSKDDDVYRSHIWLVNANGDGPYRFSNGANRDTSPRWSLDGSTIAFVSKREDDKEPQLYVLPAGGGEAVRLTNLDHGVSDPVWSPDSSTIAFVSKVGGWETPQDEKEKDKSKPARIITTMKYREDGNGFTYDQHPHIFVVAAEGGEARQLTSGDYADADPCWSPDGESLAFVSSRHDSRDSDDAADVWMVGLEDGALRKLTDTSGPVASPAFSPDGRFLAFLGSKHLNDTGRNMRLYKLSLDSGDITCLTKSLDRTCEPGAFDGVPVLWDPAGAAILVAVEDRGTTAVFTVPATNAGKPAPAITGIGKVTGLSMSDDGSTLAYLATVSDSPPELYLHNMKQETSRRLTDLNGAWKEEVSLAQPEHFDFTRDGFSIDGWVMKPFGWEPGKEYPAILNIHGGPATQYANRFFDEFQVLAGAGYGVVYCNPRGSQGRGEAFTRAVIGDWGGGDYADVMAAIDEAARRHPWIDRSRLGVMGGSYGGFLTSWIVGHTSLFKAACSERALNDHRTFFGTSDIGPRFSTAHSKTLPWEEPQWYIDHSPLTYAPDIRTPLLIMHAENDVRCPIEQAEQLYIALKYLKRDVTLVRFPDETHELSRSGTPRHRIERFGIILDWFDRYLNH
jgi:dipeptidyl aminopeptidase/acylaminoacyl peptidase